MDGADEVSYESIGIAGVQDLDALDLSEIPERLAKAPLPAEREDHGAIMLKAVVELREVTANVAASSGQIDTDTKRLLTAARITLAVASVSLIVAIIALVK